METFLLDDFQVLVDDLVLKHKSILDILSKLQESSSRVNRSVVKTITTCGCITIDASTKKTDENMVEMLSNILNNHTSGNLCDRCREVLEQELGNHFFYIAALCNGLDLNMADIINKEKMKTNTLGRYNMIR